VAKANSSLHACRGFSAEKAEQKSVRAEGSPFLGCCKKIRLPARWNILLQGLFRTVTGCLHSCGDLRGSKAISNPERRPGHQRGIAGGIATDWRQKRWARTDTFLMMFFLSLQSDRQILFFRSRIQLVFVCAGLLGNKLERRRQRLFETSEACTILPSELQIGFKGTHP